MSPFKGQEQIKHYWIALARSITRECRPLSQWREADKESVLTEFESEMLERSAIKVKHSAEAAQFYILKLCHEGDEPRGRCPNEKERNNY
jgi:hypothetical protein